ncbi:MAG: GntR family transcriptional regulator [Tannerellaceae bacterium]|nr:GntR family transcriptional regulator [Tannerellaceae bacterium]
MDFTGNKPIYLQIVDYCFRHILSGAWEEEGRIPSVRELGAQLQVNPNTVMRSYEFMQSEEVIYPKRGMGYYIREGAGKWIAFIQRKEFFKEVLPETFKAMEVLGIGLDEIIEKYKELYKS